jgi:hypothetical protein
LATVVVAASNSKHVPGGGRRAKRRIFSKTALGKARIKSDGSNAAIEIAPVVAVATTTAAFAATVVNHGQAAPPAQPSTAPRHVEHTASMVGRLSKRTIAEMKRGERASHDVLDVTHDMRPGPVARHVHHATPPAARMINTAALAKVERSEGRTTSH